MEGDKVTYKMEQAHKVVESKAYSLSSLLSQNSIWK